MPLIERILQVGRRTRAWPSWARYGFAASAVALGLLIRVLLSEELEEHPFLLFFPTVLLCAVLFELPVAGVALVLDLVATLYFLVEPRGEFRPADLNDVVRLATAATMVTIMGVVLQALIKAHDQLRAGYDELSRVAAIRAALMGEMHHRIKNNLQLVSSMLSLEAGTARSDEAKTLLRGAAARVAVIGRLHEQLQEFGAEDLVDMQDFVETLCANLRAAAVGKRPIRIESHADSLQLPSEQATSVGLLVNELVTNAVKYAFPGDAAGTITVRLERAAPHVSLLVRDDGRGSEGAAGGTGTRLVRAIISRLGGEMDVKNDGGTAVTVRFPLRSEAAP